MSRKVPPLRSDEEAEAFLEQDLSDLDFSQFKPVRFEFEKKGARVNMRLPAPLLAAGVAGHGEGGLIAPQVEADLLDCGEAGHGAGHDETALAGYPAEASDLYILDINLGSGISGAGMGASAVGSIACSTACFSTGFGASKDFAVMFPWTG